MTFRYSFFFETIPNFLNRLLDSLLLVRSTWNLQYLLVFGWPLAWFTFCENRYFHDNDKQKSLKTVKLKFWAIQISLWNFTLIQQDEDCLRADFTSEVWSKKAVSKHLIRKIIITRWEVSKPRGEVPCLWHTEYSFFSYKNNSIKYAYIYTWYYLLQNKLYLSNWKLFPCLYSLI